jgi:hypothetical protein
MGESEVTLEKRGIGARERQRAKRIVISGRNMQAGGERLKKSHKMPP